MSNSPMIGARVPQDWYQQIQEIAQAAGREKAEILREALAQYLGKTDPAAVNGAITDLQKRVTELEQRRQIKTSA